MYGSCEGFKEGILRISMEGKEERRGRWLEEGRVRVWSRESPSREKLTEQSTD